jgi:hypothetical protein
VAGTTSSADFPLTKGVFSTAFPTWTSQSFLTVFNAAEMKSLPASKLTLTSSANPQVYGSPVTITAQVEESSGSQPTGSVAFSVFDKELSDESLLGMGPWNQVDLDSVGFATFEPMSVLSGPITIDAYYLGDANNAATFASMTQTIEPVPTVTTLTESLSNAPYGSPITFAATVLDDSGKPALGQATFFVNGVAYWGVVLYSNGRATWVPGVNGQNLPVGTDTVTAKFDSEISGVPYASSSASVTATISALGITAAPAFNPPAGTYTSIQQVSLGDDNSSAAIYFTVDGSPPVVGASELYVQGSPIQVSTNETVRAVAIAPGYSSSSVASATYTINLSPPDFALTVSPSTLALTGGQSGTVAVGLNSTNGFSGAVSLSCSGLPVGASCAFSPSTISPGNTSALRITTSSRASSNPQTTQPFRVPSTIALGMLFVFWRSRRNPRSVDLFALLVGVLMTICACGGGGGASSSNSGAPPPITSTVTITGVSGSLTHSVQLVLTVD